MPKEGDWRRELWRIASIVDMEWMSASAATAIGNLFEALKPKRILEIGTYKGVGSCYLGALGEFYGGQVTTVDLPWTGESNERFVQGAEHYLSLCEVTNVEIIRRADGAEGFLREHFLNNQQRYDFIYIDAGHQWKDTAAQYAMSCMSVRVGGWLCFDDIVNEKWPEVGSVWKYLVKPRHRHVYESKGMGFCMRETVG